MNTIRKLLEANYDEVKMVIEKAYGDINSYQMDKDSEVLRKRMYRSIMEAAEKLEMFKSFIPLYKQKYFDIVKNYRELCLSSRDLIMAFDRMVYELHTRLEKKLPDSTEYNAWSQLMKEVLDGRRAIPGNISADVQSDMEFIASGLTVVGGHVISRIKIIGNRNDLDKVQLGDIVVSRMTTPDLIIVIDKVSGIITEQGGQYCHAAIIAREYDIPCIVGCGSFISLVKDREILDMDAYSGTVFRSI